MPAAAPAPQPEETPQPQQAAPSETPQAAPRQQQGGERPITRYAHKAQALTDNLETSAAQRVKGVRGWIREKLGFERPAPTEVGILKTPFVTAGHVLDGPVLGTLRATQEIAEPSVDLLRAGWRCSISKIMHPFRTLFHPIDTIKDFLRLGTSAAMVTKNAAVAPIHIADDTVTRSVDNANQQINFKTAKVPLIGKLYAKASNWVTGLGRKMSNGIRKGIDWLLSPIDKIHDAVAPA